MEKVPNGTFLDIIKYFHSRPHSTEKFAGVYKEFEEYIKQNPTDGNALTYMACMNYLWLGGKGSYDETRKYLDLAVKMNHPLAVAIACMLTRNPMFDCYLPLCKGGVFDETSQSIARQNMLDFHRRNSWDSLSLLFIGSEQSLQKAIDMGNPSAACFLKTAEFGTLQQLVKEGTVMAFDRMLGIHLLNNEDPSYIYKGREKVNYGYMYGSHLFGTYRLDKLEPRTEEQMKLGIEYILSADKIFYYPLINQLDAVIPDEYIPMGKPGWHGQMAKDCVNAVLGQEVKGFDDRWLMLKPHKKKLLEICDEVLHNIKYGYMKFIIKTKDVRNRIKKFF